MVVASWLKWMVTVHVTDNVDLTGSGKLLEASRDRGPSTDLEIMVPGSNDEIAPLPPSKSNLRNLQASEQSGLTVGLRL